MPPLFFAEPSLLRKWFEENYDKEKEVWIGYYKKGSKIPSIDWPQSVREALCFGWIDGITKSIDENSYMIRFTPRKPKSIWSAVNIKLVDELTKQGSMTPAGIAAFEKREEKNSKVYSFEQEKIEMDPSFEEKFKLNEKAWNFFQSQPPSYKKPAIWWVISAKQEATRIKRLETLIRDSENFERIKSLTRRKKGDRS